MLYERFLPTTPAAACRHARRMPRTALLLACLLLHACAVSERRTPALDTLAPLQMPERHYDLADAAAVPSPDLLAIDDEMRAFVQRYTGGMSRARQRLMSLHRAIRGAATLGVRYDPAAEGTARDVFHGGSANCLSYATLFVALAREAGLKAHYQWVDVRPQWSLQGERVLLRLHVNVLVQPGRSERYMVDIDPLPTREVAGSRLLSDSDALALYHANIAMYALADEDIVQAWLHSARALQLGPGLAQLWVNIGAVYRQAGQHRAAERSYMTALDLEPGNDSAMNNLVVLYRIEGREEERARWERKVEDYRDSNPYYHAWLGDQAAQELDWAEARSNYQQALKLLPDDSRLLYSLGIAHHEMKEHEQASRYIRQAIERATLRSDIDTYRLRLKDVEQAL